MLVAPSAYLLTRWCRVLLEKLTGLQLVKKLPAFHGTQRFITALTSVRHLSLSWATPIQSIYPHPTSWRSILILSTHLHLGLPSGLLPSGFPTKTLQTPLSSDSTRLLKLLKIAEFRTPTPQGVRKKGSKILKLPPVRNCFTLPMTNKLVVIINSLKVPKINKILLYDMKFLVPNYSCLQNP